MTRLAAPKLSAGQALTPPSNAQAPDRRNHDRRAAHLLAALGASPLGGPCPPTCRCHGRRTKETT